MIIARSNEQAKSLADTYRQADPTIESVLWFPDEDEIRVLLVSREIGSNFNDSQVHPFYFRPMELEGTIAPSAVAYVSAAEVGKVGLPMGWGNWNDAVPI